MIESLTRINELATKAKHEGLTKVEIEERDELRQAYLKEIRGQVKSTMSSVTVVNENGEDVTPEKLVVKKAKQYQHFFNLINTLMLGYK
ncbi:DUF896 domain-containing protein [Oceanobacillus piezotolerans]|uniref:UPF0291 protein D8M04_19500 n=1 Tax=Oceanobacillus piezotolerans TaxID=2448030 RepID=A0A498D473_9BACI|nr:DUF896 domain-containing protein [Oceanobacillus piezotolerans]RLL40128.1 DUF896 domain-containing protein [Oceanobacillus piezotolerans]